MDRKKDTDVSLTVKNFITRNDVKQPYSEAIQYGIDNEFHAKYYYSQLLTRRHKNFQLNEQGLLVSNENPWLAASLDGIRSCSCCKNSVLVEIKCPFKGRNLDLKEALLLDSVGGFLDEDGVYKVKENNLHYFQVQTGMAVFFTCCLFNEIASFLFLVI